MDIRQLKTLVESKSNIDLPIIFLSKINFLPDQYINEIKAYLGKTIEYTDILIGSSDMFFDNISDTIRVSKLDTLDILDNSLFNEKDLIIVASEITNKCKEIYEDIIIEVPQLEKWQIEDYASSLLPEISESNSKWLCKICNYDIYRLDQEVSKFNIFSSVERNSIFNDATKQGLFDDLSNQTVFDFTNAILKKDLKTVFSLYKKIGVVDIEPLGVVTILKKNFLDLITVQLHSNPSPDICGMKPNKFWAVKYNCNIWSNNKLIENFYFLLTVDEMIKTGKIGNTIELIDYILCNIM